jgi:hypothetical protein
MTPRSEFKMETRHDTGRHINWAGIDCGKCGKEDWTQVKNGGWATREFRKRGWKVGNKPGQHRCPDCFGRAIAVHRHIPDNAAIPPHIGVALLEDHVKKNLLDTSSLNHDLSGPGDVPWASSADLVPPHPPHDPGSVVLIRVKAVRGGQPPKPGVTVFTRRDNAVRSALKFAGGTEGVSFFVYPLADGWTWNHANRMTKAEKDACWERKSLPLNSHGKPRKRPPNPTHEPKPTPQEVAQITTAQFAKPKEEVPMTVVSLTQKEPPMPQHHADPAPVISALAPTRDQRGLIHDELTKVYDLVGQRYAGSDSDKTVGERLDLPRAWVSDIRAMFFGDHDRNQQSEKQKLKLDAAIDMAKAATQHLMNMAAEAEAIEKSLTEARKLLEG